MRAVIDIAIIAIIVICVWSGYKKGIVMGVGGIIVIIVSLYAANIVASTFSAEFVPAMRPFASGYMEKQLDEDGGVLDAMGWSGTDYSAKDLLEIYPDEKHNFAAQCYMSIGIYETSANAMAGKAVELYGQNGGEFMDSVVYIACETISYMLCYILSFLLILIILTVIGNLPNLSYKIPNLDTLNDAVGAGLGLVTGVLFSIILVWALKFTGIIIGSDTLGETVVARVILKLDFLIKFLGV